MKNTIYEYIQKNKAETFTFDDLFNHFSSTNKELTKQVLGLHLKQLEQEGLTAEINKKFIDLTSLPETQGYVHWNINHLAWIENSDNTNEYGIAFNPNENLLGVYNKKKAFYGSLVKGRLIEHNEKRTLYITEILSKKEVKLFAVYRKDFNSWNILNSGSGFRFKASDTDIDFEIKDGDIATFNTVGDRFSAIEKIGNITDKGIESRILQSIAHIYDTPDDNSEFNLKPLPVLNKPFFTVDGLSTKDIDDAIWMEKDSSGYKLWVAIADVSSFVKPGDSQDTYAKDKCTSFYFLNDTVHMLSRTLAENYCSLTPGDSRRAMICELSYDLAGNLLKYEFSNNEIKSHARLTYHDVDSVLQGNNPKESLVYKDGFITKWSGINEPGTQWISSSLKIFEEFTNLKTTEYKPDYWFVPSVELSIGEDGKVDHLYIDVRDETKSQKIVETCMLAANKAAAQFLCEKYPYIGLFRNQNAPIEEFERPKPAFYHADNEGHWGLQTEFYTHFTSPIRRFCDLIAHRLIKDVLQGNESVYDKNAISSIVEQINYQQYVTKQMNNREKNLLSGQYLEKMVNNKEMQVKAKLVDFNDNGIVIRNNQLIETFIPKFKVDKNILAVLQNFSSENANPVDKERIISEINNNWKIKFFIDNYHWLDDRKEATYKFYPRDFSDEPNQEKRVNVKI